MNDNSAGEVFRAFLKLGITSFGGPVAHLGYLRAELVERRRWLDESAFAELVALCQLLPGPASSKLGFSLGYLRSGWAGAFAAWLAFTMPSALALYAFAGGARAFGAHPLGAGALHGLKLAAVAIVAHAAWTMSRALCPDVRRRILAAACAALVLALGSGAQLPAIVLGALVGLAVLRDGPPLAGTLGAPIRRRTGACAALAFLALLIASLAMTGPPVAAMGAAFYRAGALVFGGGHVVLPLLNDAVVAPGWVSQDAFLAGYGAAQAVPGPLFTFAAYVGAQPGMPLPGAAGATLAVGAIFLPGLLLQIAALASWSALRERPAIAAAMRGVNAAVVGLLVAALWSPVWAGAVHGIPDAGVAIGGFLLLTFARLPPLAIVAASALAGIAIG